MAHLEKRMRGLSADLLGVIVKLADKEMSPKGVHRLRTTIRRIESLVSYAHPALEKKLERSLEKLAHLRKLAGKVRDLDVQIGLLNALGNGSTIQDRKVLAELLKKKRERQATRLGSALGKLQGSKFIARMNRIAEKAGAMQNGANRPLAPLVEARSQLAEMANEFSSSQRLGRSRLHEARISLKRIRYLAELAEESPAQKVFIHELKAVQDAVGDWHDWQELSATAEKRFSERVNCALLREVRALLAARHSSATSSVNNLFTLALAPARKPPRPAQFTRTLARHA
jgi:CHAD domain-containing protein